MFDMNGIFCICVYSLDTITKRHLKGRPRHSTRPKVLNTACQDKIQKNHVKTSVRLLPNITRPKTVILRDCSQGQNVLQILRLHSLQLLRYAC